MLVAVKPLHDQFTIKRIVVSTYQSVSGAGKEAADELFNQTKSIYSNEAVVKEKFTKQIAFNVIPHIDVFLEDGQTKEEWKMYNETKKILDPKIELTATCVRVPVFVSHSLAINLEFEKEYEEDQVREIFKSAPGLKMIDYRADEGYVTPVESAGLDPVYVSRIRRDPTIKNGLNFWCVSDNLRKGAALNTVQIAEILIKDYLSS
jgi:aspartate-semialdehyde dehydrogenase